MSDEFKVADADAQEALNKAVAAEAVKKQANLQNPAQPAQTQPPTTNPSQPTANPTPPASDKRVDRARAAADQELTDWWVATSYSMISFNLDAGKSGQTITVTAQWKYNGYDYNATFDAATGWMPKVTIKTRVPGDHVVNNRKDIEAAIQAEADLAKKYTEVASEWLAKMDITIAPKLTLNFTTQTIWWMYSGYKFIAVVDGKKLKTVKLVIDVPGRSTPLETDVTSKANFDNTLANPPQLTNEEIAQFQGIVALNALISWLGGSGPGSYRSILVEADRTILQATIYGRQITWTHRPSTNSLEVLAEVPPGTPGAIELRGKHYVTVLNKDEITTLPKP